MVCACIDIGSNTTRLLVARVEGGRMVELRTCRDFTRLARGRGPAGELSAARVAETVEAVAAQAAVAAELGAQTRIRAVATGVVRAAPDRDRLLDAIAAHCGVVVDVLDERQEAELAFAGATRTLGRRFDGTVAVLDVGGGSSEIAVGTVAGGVDWSVSVPIGSGVLAERLGGEDPPGAATVSAARESARAAFAEVRPPPVEMALAVGGSAASLRRVVGPRLDPQRAERALAAVLAGPAIEVAATLGLDPERVRLLPAGLAVLCAAAERVGRPLELGCGGLREGVLLAVGDAAAAGPAAAAVTADPGTL